MRHLSLGLIAVLTLTSAALASTPDTYNRATATVSTTEAAFGEAVNFTMPASSVDLSAALLKPGGQYTVSVPVTNDTDRPITVNLLEIRKGGTYDGSLVTVTPTISSVNLAAGGASTIEFTVELSADATIEKTAGKTLTLTFDFEGVSDETGQ